MQSTAFIDGSRDAACDGLMQSSRHAAHLFQPNHPCSRLSTQAPPTPSTVPASPIPLLYPSARRVLTGWWWGTGRQLRQGRHCPVSVARRPVAHTPTTRAIAGACDRLVRGAMKMVAEASRCGATSSPPPLVGFQVAIEKGSPHSFDSNAFSGRGTRWEHCTTQSSQRRGSRLLL